MAGTTPDLELTAEQRVDAAIASARLGQAGLGSLGIGERLVSGGGGRGGRFVFADLAALDTAISRWDALRDRIQDRGKRIDRAMEHCNPPADDLMSHYQADAARATMDKKREHNDAMLAYANAYVQKLTESRTSMAATEQTNSDRLRNAGGDLGPCVTP